MTVTPEQVRSAMASFAAGVTVVTTLEADGSPQGLTATAFSSVSMQPPLCLVCLDHRSRTFTALTEKKRFAVSMLKHSQEPVSNQFAAAEGDKFADVPWTPGQVTGCPLIDGALASVECEVESVHRAGDHDIFVGRIVSIAVGDGMPLVYFRGAYAELMPEVTPATPTAEQS